MDEKTLVSAVAARFRERPRHPAQRYKLAGRWIDQSYGELGRAVAETAAGLRALGLQTGDRAALLSRNRPEWAVADLGILFAGGVTVTIYPTSLARETAYIVGNSESRFLFVEDAEQLAKAESERANLPGLERCLTLDGVGGRAGAMDLAELRARGAELLRREPDALDRVAASLRRDDLAAVIYTSGTTGPPKGVMLTHGNILFVLDAIARIIPNFGVFERNLSFLPLSHAMERVGGHFLPLVYGRTIGYAESLEKVVENFREVQPQIAIAVPRVFEKTYAGIQNAMKEASPRRRAVFEWAVRIGRQAVECRERGEAAPWTLAVQRAAADRLVFRKLREAFGGKLMYFVSGGAPLSATIARFFSAAGILVLEGWGATETAAPATLNLPYAFRLGSVGRPLPGVEVCAAGDGELLIRGPNVFRGYWKMPAETAAALDAEGWHHTGDIGQIDGDGFVYIADRKKELIITSGGKNISPQNIENRLKLSPLIANAMAVGDRRNYLAALIALNAPAVAKKLGLADADPAQLAARDDVRELIQTEVNAVNNDLPRFEQVRRFRLLPRDFTVEDDELSPTLKLKRRNVVARWGALIDAMYEG